MPDEVTEQLIEEKPTVYPTEVPELKASVSIIMLTNGQIRSHGVNLDRPLLNMLILTGLQDLLASLAKPEAV
jgi:hypothetical protein